MVFIIVLSVLLENSITLNKLERFLFEIWSNVTM